ncbi:MAG: hypothetical protein ACK5SX_01025 [Sandaracinobacter sp.]
MSKHPEGPADAGGCGPCTPSRRNRYYRDKRLHVADYVLEQDYHIQRRRLVNRAMLGWGVVEGFAIDSETLTVGSGIAIDPQGRELVACAPVKLDASDVLWLGESKGGCGCRLDVVDPPAEPAPNPNKPGDGDDCCDNGDDPCAGLYLLAAHYAEKHVDPVRIDDGCGGARCEANQVCETVVYSLRPVDCCPSGLPDCHCPACAGDDLCGCEDVDPYPDDAAPPSAPDKGPPKDDSGQQPTPTDDSKQLAAAPANAPKDQAYSLDDGKKDPTDHRCYRLDRGNHRQLVRWSEIPPDGFDSCLVDKLVRHGCFALDPCGGVPLACVKIDWHCGEPRVAVVVDDAHPRRLARSNESLFDLIRGCDLTRIQDVGWGAWLKGGTAVPRSTFSEMFLSAVDLPAGDAVTFGLRGKPLLTKFTVRFSGPVRTETLTPDIVAISLIQPQRRERVDDIVRLPVIALQADAHKPGDPAGTTRGFAVLTDSAFYAGEIVREDVSGFDDPTVVEIEIRADWIIDCNGQEVAGGGRSLPSTGSVPGGRFLSSFTVVPNKRTEPETDTLVNKER